MGRSFRLQSVAGARVVETRGDIGDGRSTYPPLRLRGRLTVRWESGVWSAGWTGRYTSEYLTNSTAPTAANPNKTGYDGTSINPSFEMDLQLTRRVAYTQGTTLGWRRALAGTQWTVGCLNVLDQKPSYITTFLGWYSQSMVWPQHFDGGGRRNAYAVRYGIKSVPTKILLGRDGQVAASRIPTDQLPAVLAKLLSQ